jgi:histidinol dehydrogenase
MSTSTEGLVRFSGRCDALSPGERRNLFDRTTSADDSVRERVSSIIRHVRERGDDALRDFAREFDGVELDALEVRRQDCEDALSRLDTGLRRAMERSARNIRRVHEAFRPAAQEIESEEGVFVGRRPDPLRRVGVYAPGGRAAYPSSVLMGAIPARVAGVEEVIVCSPPSRDTGVPSDVVLAAAALSQADRVFALGGAGAIAALAYGTSSVPRVDRVVGPGNAYVAEAKIQVASAVAIDSPAGPSELLVLCDENAPPTTVAREMLAQAEHDPRAAVVAITTTPQHASAILEALARMLPDQPRADVAAAALCNNGGVLWEPDREEAISFANEYAAEHLLLMLEPPGRFLPQLRGAGTIFVGESSSVAFGDYMTGANHVLPTGGLARCYSGLSTLDFVRWTTWQRVTRDAAARMAGDVAMFAGAEGLGGHALAASAWQQESTR